MLQVPEGAGQACQVAGAAEAAVAQAVTDHHKQLEITMGILSQTLADGLHGLREQQQQQQQDLVTLVIAVARKLAGAALAHAPIETLTEHVAQTLASLHAEPEVEIRVAASLKASVQPMMDACAQTAGFRGVMTITGDELLAPGDCRIFWRQGASERLLENVLAAVEPLIQRHFMTPTKE